MNTGEKITFNTREKMTLLAYILGFIFTGVGIYCLFADRGVVLSVVLLVLGIFDLACGIWSDNDLKRKNKQAKLEREIAEQQKIEAEQKKREEEQKKEDAEVAEIKSGKWKEFPVRNFYVKCTDLGVNNLDSAFAVQKATMVAKEILASIEHFPNGFIDQYCSEEKLREYWIQGKEVAEKMEAQALEEKRKPKNGQLTDAERTAVVLGYQLKQCFGIQKRIVMLDETIQKIDKKISDYVKGQQAMRELGGILGSSVYQEKKKDWAFLGGLADGIAGPGAGLAVASNAIAENREIERRNQLARQESVKLMKSFYDGSSKLSEDVGDLSKEMDLLEYHKNQAKFKVVLEQYSTEEIFKSLTISSRVSKSKSGKSTVLSVNICNSFVADVPENVLVAVDGTLEAKIYFEGTLVDTVCVYLPLFGVAEKASEKIEAISSKYVEADGDYTVEFTPNKLWVVEV